MKYNKLIIAAAALLIGTFSCTDNWNEHYDEAAIASQGVTYNGTLCQAISENPDLSNFYKVLKATGYADLINSTQVFTIFAPTNNDFTEQEADKLIQQYNEQKAINVKERDNTVVKEFIQNHIALYNYSVNPEMPDTTINLLNGKKVKFTKEAFDGNKYLTANLLAHNGVLYTMDKQARYKNNIYEEILADKDLDSLKQFIYKFTLNRLNTMQSVPGPIVDGKQTYLDSVTNKENEIFTSTWLNADLWNEDSTYWMLAPDNKQWKQMVETYSKYYNYDNKIAERDSLMFMFPRIDIIEGTVFSKSWNKKVFETMQAEKTDSMMSTNAQEFKNRKKEYGSFQKAYNQYKDPFGEAGIMEGMVAEECSNGKIFKGSKWNIQPKATFLRDIIMEGENSATIDSLFVLSKDNPLSKNPDTKEKKTITVASTNLFYDKVSNHQYIEIAPRNSAAGGGFSNARFNVSNVLSNVPYDVYVVVAPGEAAESYTQFVTEEDCMPTRFRVSVVANDVDGIGYYMAKPAAGGVSKAFYESGRGSNKKKTSYYVDPQNRQKGINTQASAFQVEVENTPGKVDSVFIGTYIFPTCSYYTSEAQVKLVIKSQVDSNLYKSGYRPTLRLDDILFIPKEQ